VPGTDRSLNDFVIKHIKYNQDNSHHTLSLGEHSLTVAHNFEKPMLYYAGLLHDCGKPFTKSFTNYKGEISEDAHYYGHECVGAYESLFFRYPDEDNINELDISILINLHMRPYFWEKDKEHGEKTREKYRKLWGEELYQNVMKLHEADKKAH
jgi:CRISPR/Cas system-associated endonuclease Cas3-HD